MEKFTQFYSGAVLGTGNNNGILLKGGDYVLKSYYKLRALGKNTFKLFFVNSVDSTGNCRIGKLGDSYEIVSAYAAFTRDMKTEENITPITFNNCPGKQVQPGEEYSSDEFQFTYNDDGYMVLSFCVKKAGRWFLPGTNESASTGRIIENGKEIWCDNFTLRPCFVGVKKEKRKTVGFFGDSITQGSRTGIECYEAWTHQIGNSMPEDISVWNLGMGWARCYDAAADGIFLKKAAMCDEVFMCFGVNDIRSGGSTAEELIADMEKTKKLLCKYNKNIKVHFMTVPPFNMTVYEEEQRKKVNEYIKTTDGCFDIAACLECDAIGSVKPEFMSSPEDAHPNGKGGSAIKEEFLKWWKEKGL